MATARTRSYMAHAPLTTMGELLYRTGLGHGDALHVGDLNPDHEGLEVMMVHEEKSAKYGMEMHDALTGEHLSGVYAGSDVGRGMCADVDANTGDLKTRYMTARGMPLAHSARQ